MTERQEMVTVRYWQAEGSDAVLAARERGDDLGRPVHITEQGIGYIVPVELPRERAESLVDGNPYLDIEA